MSMDLKQIMDEYAQLPFSLGPVRCICTPPGHVVDGYRTYLSAFIIPFQGNAQLCMSENSYELQSGKIIHGCPGKWLTARNRGNSPFKFFTLYYKYDGQDSNYMHCPYELEINFTPKLFSILQQLSSFWKTPDTQLSLEMKTLAYSALSEIFSCAKSMDKADTHSVIEDAKNYIEHYYMQPQTLSDLGHKYNMSGKYFSEVFKKYTGIGPIDYLISCRLKQSRRLLENTECSIKEIGQSVGYEDPLYFSRQFSRHYGISPSKFRQQSIIAHATSNLF